MAYMPNLHLCPDCDKELPSCEICGEEFDPETSRYDDTCDLCADEHIDNEEE